ncbi:MAG: patatin family protein [Erysipelotrichaceae bacterium]|nr:patatin family protein [Erysipelotrichaceae bacterium]
MSHKVYSGLNQLPNGQASDDITKGCIVLEGGAFRAVYGEGVLDALMKENINFECTIGTSAGALNGLNYVSGQIGRSARFNLGHRHDGQYVTVKNFMNDNKGIINFDFLLDSSQDIEDPFNEIYFNHTPRRFIATATNCLSGKVEYFEKGKCHDIYQAVRASASMPYFSKMVDIDGKPYLDGGCEDKIPYRWAIKQGYKKIIVVRTRPKWYRKDLTKKHDNLARRVYHDYPSLIISLNTMNERYNYHCDEIERLERERRLFVYYPSENHIVGRLESDMEKLGNLYYLGYIDAKQRMKELRDYLAH